MHAFTEHLISVIRVGKTTVKYGDPFEQAVIVRWLSPTTAELAAMNSQTRFTTQTFRAIEAELVRLGITEVFWTRRGEATARRIVRHKRDVSRAQPGQSETPQQGTDVHPDLA